LAESEQCKEIMGILSLSLTLIMCMDVENLLLDGVDVSGMEEMLGCLYRFWPCAGTKSKQITGFHMLHYQVNWWFLSALG